MSRAAYALPSCSNEDCNQSTNPISEKECGKIIYDADITSLILAPADFDTSTFDWSAIADWTTAIDNTTAGSVIKLDRFEGGIPRVSRPNETIIGVKKFDPFPFVLEGEAIDVNATNHDTFQKMQTCPSQFLVFWETGENELLWGSPTGVLANVMVELAGERGGYLSYFFVIDWESDCMPYFIASPFS